MRIAINADFLAEPRTGAGRYIAQLVEALGRIDGVNDYLVLTHRHAASHPSTPSTFHWEEAPVRAPSKRLRKIRWEQHDFPERARKKEARMAFVPYFAPPIRAAMPIITTIHDVIPFALPDYRPLSPMWVYLQLLARAARRAAVVIATSDFTKSEIIRLLGIPTERIFVIPAAAGSQFHPIGDLGRLYAARQKYDAGERFVLYVGGFDLRKNVPLLIGAFAAAMHRLGDATTRLVISGDASKLGTSALYPDWRPLAHRFGIESRVIAKVISDDDLPLVYNAALALVYPSSYEGFGLPPLEAMACGTPVVVSDHPALREVVGSAGLTFPASPPGESSSLAATRALSAQIAQVVSTPGLREDLHLRGLARSKQFSWAQAAAETSGIFADIAGIRH
jgi:glycosyltransferase involved in cell wall biosynthesis